MDGEAVRYCRDCDCESFARECRTVPAGASALLLCPHCGMVTRAQSTVVRRPFTDCLLEAVLWPAQGDNRITWASVGACVALGRHVPLVGAPIAVSVRWTYLLLVIARGARGEEEAPAASDFSSFWDLVLPLFRGSLSMLLAAVPLLVVLWAWGPGSPTANLVAACLGVALFPACVASAAIDGSLVRALDPRPVLALVLSFPRAYAMTVATLAAVTLGWVASVALAAAVVHVALRGVWLVPSLAGFVAEVAAVYFPLAMARVVAVLLREHATELGIAPLPSVGLAP